VKESLSLVALDGISELSEFSMTVLDKESISVLKTRDDGGLLTLEQQHFKGENLALKHEMPDLKPHAGPSSLSRRIGSPTYLP